MKPLLEAPHEITYLCVLKISWKSSKISSITQGHIWEILTRVGFTRYESEGPTHTSILYFLYLRFGSENIHTSPWITS